MVGRAPSALMTRVWRSALTIEEKLTDGEVKYTGQNNQEKYEQGNRVGRVGVIRAEEVEAHEEKKGIGHQHGAVDGCRHDAVGDAGWYLAKAHILSCDNIC